MATNLRSAVYLTCLAAPHLIKTRGNIINISSVAAVDPMGAGNFSYCTSKAGMDHFSRAAALELGPQGVRVNTVNPGPVRTDFIENMGVQKADHDKFWKQVATNIPLRRVSEPVEIADLVLFIAGDKAKAITGSSYFAENGILLQRS